MPRPRLVLASASPARLATLRSAGLDPEVQVSGVDEEGVDAGSPAQTALELARLKCEAVRVLRPHDPDAGDEYVLGCDSVLELDGRTLGKPSSAADARDRWRAMRGRSGVLHTGHALAKGGGAPALTRCSSTVVRFAEPDDEEIDAYIATGEPLGVAGAFTIDGLGGAFVRGIEGDHHGVVGVSLPLLRVMLGELGVRWTHLWSPPAMR